jgi:hypothetical protein
MADTRQVDAKEAHKVGAALGVDWTKADPEQFRRDLEVEIDAPAMPVPMTITS